MERHYENYLRLEGDETEISRFVAKAGVGDDFIVSNFLGFIEAEYDSDTHIFAFVTQDSPPDKAIIVAVSKQYQVLKFTFEYKISWDPDDSIVDFGRFVCRDGKIESEEYGQVKAVFCPECNQIVTYVKL